MLLPNNPHRVRHCLALLGNVVAVQAYSRDRFLLRPLTLVVDHEETSIYGCQRYSPPAKNPTTYRYVLPTPGFAEQNTTTLSSLPFDPRNSPGSQSQSPTPRNRLRTLQCLLFGSSRESQRVIHTFSSNLLNVLLKPVIMLSQWAFQSPMLTIRFPEVWVIVFYSRWLNVEMV